MIPISLKNRCRQQGNGKSCLFEDLALIEGLVHLLEGPFPGTVLTNQCLGLLAARIQFLPCVWLKVHLPIWTQGQGKLLACEDPGSRNGADIVASKEDCTGKGILPQFVQLLEHSSDETATPEGLGELLRKAILRPTILITVLLKIRQHHIVSLLDYLCLNSSNTKVLLDKWAKGSWLWAQQPVPVHIHPSPQEQEQPPFSPFCSA